MNLFTRLRKKISLVLAFALICAVPLMCVGTAQMAFAAEEDDTINSVIQGVNDLPGHTIGVQLGTTGDIYASGYDGDKAGSSVVKYTRSNDAILALKQDKVDCVIIDKQPAIEFVKNNPELKILEEEFVVEEYAICVAKGNEELVDKLNAALDEIKADGTLENIINYYLNNEDGSIEKYQKKDVKRNGQLIMATNAMFPPYESMNGAGELVGIDVDIAYALTDVLGVELKIDNIDFDAIIAAVSSGKADFGLAGMTVTEDRLKNINFTNSYTTSQQVIIVKDKNVVVEDKPFIEEFKEKFKNDFIEDSRWKNLATGLKNTVLITLLSTIMGIVLGFITAIVRSTYDKTGKLKIANFIANIYLTVIRGTPAVVQLLIIYYVVFASVDVNKVVAAVLAFGINSGAYVAEIVRSGIMSVPQGQMEAGRSLGLNYFQTMTSIIMPQAFKNVLPALGNEFIVLLKETSVAGYIGLMDLTRGGDNIRSATYDAFLPLIAVALIYLVMVSVLTVLVNKLERRLRRDEQ